MEALILLTLIGIFWLVSPRRWRRVIKLVTIVALAGLMVTSPGMVQLTTWGLTVPLPADRGEQPDAIVVLGRGEELRERRVDLIHKLWQAGRAPRVFTSGMMDAQPTIERLQQKGLPGSILSGESCSRNTEENALYTAAILYPQGVRKIILMTDSPHMLRSFLLFRNVGFKVMPYLSPLPDQWNSLQQITVILREYVGLIQYALMGRFRQRSTSELKHPSSAILEKFTEWNCQV
ncbi:YdcF family protein [Phormidesmis priestleyi ULC007]|uniref:YdcF family protein n=1 Tax=Phormidesmis priestleyi ULC007 TaxID=1920490 RepID=A0A2T1D319_9CYAN|nr:YdcF family protein [Phormidesmis priestleyi]PSB14902.1 YdcF family protein [Phormidesmis priestleyi ULC007]